MSARELERIEENVNIQRLREAPHILHQAGGLTENFVYEPVSASQYVYKTKDGKKGLASIKTEYENEDTRKPHFSLEIEGSRFYFADKPPKELLFQMPELETVKKWVNGEKQSLATEKLQTLNAVYLRTFLDFPHKFEFSIIQLFIQQSWLSEILPVVFYLGIKGEYGGGKTVTGEAIVSVCRHGYFTGNVSAPFVARAIQNQKLTLMVDELDSIAKTKDSELNSIFRQGYRRGLKYSRVNSDTYETESFLIFGAKLFTVHSDIEEALQTRTIPIHIRETSNVEFPIVNLDKLSASKTVYTQNFLWYLDHILSFKENEMHLLSGLNGFSLDPLDTLDPLDSQITPIFSERSMERLEKQAENIRETLFQRLKTLLTEGQVSQVCQVNGRNVELMFICFAISNLTKIRNDEDIVKTFNQKQIEEGEKTEIGNVGILKDVLCQTWKEKKDKPQYITEDGAVKISYKEIYGSFNKALKTENDMGISPPKFNGYLLQFGFMDGLNKKKLEVPIPGDDQAKSRMCLIFNDYVLRKIGLTEEEEETSLKEVLENIVQWIRRNKDSESLVSINALTSQIKTVTSESPPEIIQTLMRDGRLFEVPKDGFLGVI